MQEEPLLGNKESILSKLRLVALESNEDLIEEEYDDEADESDNFKSMRGENNEKQLEESNLVYENPGIKGFQRAQTSNSIKGKRLFLR